MDRWLERKKEERKEEGRKVRGKKKGKEGRENT